MEGPRDSGHLTQQLRRERLLDLDGRMAKVRRRAMGVLALALVVCAPWIGPTFLVPLVLSVGAFALADRRLRTSSHPERWIITGWAIAPATIAMLVAFTGGPESAATAAFALTAVTLGARFDSRGVLFGMVYIAVLLLAVTVGIDPQAVADRPQLVVFPLAVSIAVLILSTAVVASDREHRHGAVVDPLTGLLNRAALAQRFAELEEQARLSVEPIAVGFVLGDIDHFKRVNDEHGHASGDGVLKDVAYALRKTLRAFDLVYRIGGEEFVILLPGADASSAEEIAGRLREAVAEAGGPIPVTMSFGVSVAHAPGLDFDGVFDEADRALYEAKRKGRDRVCVTGRAPLAV